MTGSGAAPGDGVDGVRRAAGVTGSPIRRRWLLAFGAASALAALGAGAAQAQPPDAKLDGTLRALYVGLEAAMRAGRSTPFRQRFDMLAPLIDEVFDLETVMRVSVGLRWEAIDPALRMRLLRAYRRFTVATYVANFDRYDGERFVILPGWRDLGPDRIVATETIRGSERWRVDYVMRLEDGAWRAVDVLLEGAISRVAVQRSDFRKILVGGDVEALIASLHSKITDLSGGALNS